MPTRRRHSPPHITALLLLVRMCDVQCFNGLKCSGQALSLSRRSTGAPPHERHGTAIPCRTRLGMSSAGRAALNKNP